MLIQIGLIKVDLKKLDEEIESYVITQLRIQTSLSVTIKCFYDTPSYNILT